MGTVHLFNVYFLLEIPFSNELVYIAFFDRVIVLFPEKETYLYRHIRFIFTFWSGVLLSYEFVDSQCCLPVKFNTVFFLFLFFLQYTFGNRITLFVTKI